jgi:hypothetical protein
VEGLLNPVRAHDKPTCLTADFEIHTIKAHNRANWRGSMLKLIAFAFAMTVAGLATPAFAYTPEEQAACQDDAFRLCGHAIPDVERVRVCLVGYYRLRKLSPACHRLFARGRKR